MKVVGLISSYREGGLVADAIRSALPLDNVFVLEAPIGEPPAVNGETSFLGGKWPGHVLVLKHSYSCIDDAHKRDEMVHWARERTAYDGPLWGVWIDADEILVWGEYLRSYLERIHHEEGKGEGFKFPIRIVEFDGSVALCHGKVVRLDLVARYHVSSYGVEFLFAPGVIMSLGNEPIWKPGILDENGGFVEHQDMLTATRRPPLAGEPHLLHRSALRHPDRAKVRMHDAEARSFDEMRRAAGLMNV